jgi:hypothetical protein
MQIWENPRAVIGVALFCLAVVVMAVVTASAAQAGF